MPNISLRSQSNGEITITSEFSRADAGPLLRHLSRSIAQSAAQELVDDRSSALSTIPEERHDDDAVAVIEISTDGQHVHCDFKPGRQASDDMTKYDFLRGISGTLEEAGHQMLVADARDSHGQNA